MTAPPIPWLEIGRIMGIFGVRGELRVQYFTAEAEGILAFPTWWIGADETSRQAYTLLGGRPHGKGVVVTLQGITTPEAVRPLIGATLWAPRNQLPALASEEFYWADLVGCEVVTDQGEVLGPVVAMMETGANDVLVVRYKGDEILLPFIADVAKVVDLEHKRIVVELLPGLLE